MQSRLTNWIDGLNGDWLVSRQRFFGVAFPIWYRLDATGEPAYDDPIVPDEADLPVDPAADAPTGFDESQRGKPNGFMADPDMLDTWATSSLTPQIACGWERDTDLFERTFPMDVRPQAPRHHPHVAVLHRRARAPGARHRPVDTRDDLGLRGRS